MCGGGLSSPSRCDNILSDPFGQHGPLAPFSVYFASRFLPFFLARKTSRTTVPHGPANFACPNRSQLSNFCATGTSHRLQHPLSEIAFPHNHSSLHFPTTWLTRNRGQIAVAATLTRAVASEARGTLNLPLLGKKNSSTRSSPGTPSPPGLSYR